MKKSSISFLALAVASLSLASFVFAADKVENKAAKCCADAQAAGKTCSHPCCVEAAKTGDNCTRCKGSGKITKKADAKK